MDDEDPWVDLEIADIASWLRTRLRMHRTNGMNPQSAWNTDQAWKLTEAAAQRLEAFIAGVDPVNLERVRQSLRKMAE